MESDVFLVATIVVCDLSVCRKDYTRETGWTMNLSLVLGDILSAS